MLRCPHCDEVLSRSKVADIELDGCRSCGGAFFDAGELTALARDPRLLLEVDRAFQPTQRPMAAKESRACPKCHTALVTREQSSLPGVPFEACPSCKGIWLNGGQASQIAALRGAVAPRTPADPVRPPPQESPQDEDVRHPTAAMVVGVVSLLAVIFTLTLSLRALAGDRARARVVQVERFGNHSYSRSGGWRATLQFQVGDSPITIHEDLWALDHLLRSGDEVEVIYPRDHPDQAMIGSVSRVWFVPLSFMVTGCLLTAGVYRKGFTLSAGWRRPSGWGWFDD